MRPFDHHIYHLLLDHDCVIVPALGGFLASRENARIDVARQTGIPPRRRVAFNAYLKQNDGLLAQRVAAEEHLSYPEAMQRVETFVTDCFHDLENGRKVLIRQVGHLSMDPANNLQFEPDTTSVLLPEAFGLSPVSAHPVAAGKERERIQKQREELTRLRASAHSEKKRFPVLRKRQRSLLGVLTVAGALAWFSFNVYLVSRDHFSRTSLNPLDSGAFVLSESEEVKPVSPQELIPARVETVFVSATEPVSPENATANNAAPPDTTAVSVSRPVPEPSIQPSESASWFVIAGVFRVRENAESLTIQLRSRGFDQASIIDTNARLFYVSYGRFSNRLEASTLNDSLRKNNLEGWLYRR